MISSPQMEIQKDSVIFVVGTKKLEKISHEIEQSVVKIKCLQPIFDMCRYFFPKCDIITNSWTVQMFYVFLFAASFA